MYYLSGCFISVTMVLDSVNPTTDLLLDAAAAFPFTVDAGGNVLGRILQTSSYRKPSSLRRVRRSPPASVKDVVARDVTRNGGREGGGNSLPTIFWGQHQRRGTVRERERE